MKVESRFTEKLSTDTHKCIICPRKCVLKTGETGFCGTKSNTDNKIIDLVYGQISAIAVDPIEKKPLAHFYPGSSSFSISSLGCSFTCPWCQNWHISQQKPSKNSIQYFEPQEIVETAIREKCISIAYTYNEPVINLNFVEDVARLGKENDLKNVLVTNGYISLESLSRVVDVIDAANVDWKSFNEKFYNKYCSGDLQSVLNATELMKKKGIHIELTFLIIPKLNDDIKEMKKMAEYIVNVLGEDTPLHLSRFFPHYKLTKLTPTPIKTLIDARKVARDEGLHHVYVGNVMGNEYDNTFCPECGNHVIERSGYNITGWHINDDKSCIYCGNKISITR